MDSVYDFVVEAIDGSEVALADYRGKAVLIVNVASMCGLTSCQYEELVQLSKLFPDKLEVFAFPCNQFGAQEPGTNEEIIAFAQGMGAGDFKLFAKIEVNGDGALPLFTFLRSASELQGEPIPWNFAKFLVSPEGAIKYFGPRALHTEIVPEIERFSS